jgi:hypothetical protein
VHIAQGALYDLWTSSARGEYLLYGYEDDLAIHPRNVMVDHNMCHVLNHDGQPGSRHSDPPDREVSAGQLGHRHAVETANPVSREFSACYDCGLPQDICMTGPSGCSKCRKENSGKCEDPDNCPGPCKFPKILFIAAYAALKVLRMQKPLEHLEAGTRYAIEMSGSNQGTALGKSATIGMHNVSVIFTILEKVLESIDWV